MKKFFSNIKGDAFGGITAGIVALPLALAFGVQSGLGPSAGLYGAIFISFFAALFGGTNTQISGPTAPMTALSMVVIAGLIGTFGGSVEKALPAILTVFLLAGLMQIGLGFIGVGKYIRYIPYPVVSGFMTAIGVMILVTQILPILGYNASTDDKFVNSFRAEAEEVILEKIIKDESIDGVLVLEEFNRTIEKSKEITENDIISESINLATKESKSVIGAIKLLPRALMRINWLEFLLAIGTIILIYGFKRITTKIPSTLVALIVVSAIAILGNLDYKPIPTIPQELPLPRLEIFTNFNLGSISPYIFTALTLSLLGAIDS